MIHGVFLLLEDLHKWGPSPEIPQLTWIQGPPCASCKFLPLLLPGALWFCSSGWVSHPTCLLIYGRP